MSKSKYRITRPLIADSIFDPKHGFSELFDPVSAMPKLKDELLSISESEFSDTLKEIFYFELHSIILQNLKRFILNKHSAFLREVKKDFLIFNNGNIKINKKHLKCGLFNIERQFNKELLIADLFLKTSLRSEEATVEDLIALRKQLKQNSQKLEKLDHELKLFIFKSLVYIKILFKLKVKKKYVRPYENFLLTKINKNLEINIRDGVGSSISPKIGDDRVTLTALFKAQKRFFKKYPELEPLKKKKFNKRRKNLKKSVL